MVCEGGLVGDGPPPSLPSQTAVTPEKVPVKEFVVAPEQVTWGLEQQQRDKLRADIAAVIKAEI